MLTEFKDDLELSRIAESGQCFRWQKVKDEGDSAVFRVIAGGRVLFALKKGEILDLSCSEKDYGDFWSTYLDSETSYREIRASVREDDGFLREAAANGEGIRILRQEPFETLISFIISQRKSIPAIRSSVEKLCRKAGARLSLSDRDKEWLLSHEVTEAAEEELFSFPGPGDIVKLSPEELSACGLGYRTPYVRNAAERVLYGETDPDAMKELSDTELTEELKKIHGVGVKVANCTALFGFHRLDLFPVDVWIGRILEKYYKSGFPYEAYRPYNGVMQQYMFYSAAVSSRRAGKPEGI